MFQPPRRRSLPLSGGLLALLLCGTAATLQAESLHAPWHGMEQDALLDQLLAALVEDAGSNRLFLNADTERLRSILQQLCPASVAHCKGSGQPAPATLQALAPAEVDLLLQQLASRLQATPTRKTGPLDAYLVDAAQHGSATQQPLASL